MPGDGGIGDREALHLGAAPEVAAHDVLGDRLAGEVGGQLPGGSGKCSQVGSDGVDEGGGGLVVDAAAGPSHLGRGEPRQLVRLRGLAPDLGDPGLAQPVEHALALLAPGVHQHQGDVVGGRLRVGQQSRHPLVGDVGQLTDDHRADGGEQGRAGELGERAGPQLVAGGLGDVGVGVGRAHGVGHGAHGALGEELLAAGDEGDLSQDVGRCGSGHRGHYRTALPHHRPSIGRASGQRPVSTMSRPPRSTTATSPSRSVRWVSVPACRSISRVSSAGWP